MPPLMNALLTGNAVLLFMNVFAEQLGAPLPSYPLLVASGATAGTSTRLVEFLLLASLACVLADLIWYWAGMRYGARILGWLARFTFLQGHKTTQQNRFANQGAHWLLVAKFIPGMGAMATLMAGIHKIPLTQFLAYDALGSLLWSGSALVLGRLFEAPILQLMAGAQDYGVIVGVLIAGAIAVVVLVVLVRQIMRFRAAHTTAKSQPHSPMIMPAQAGIAQARPTLHSITSIYPQAVACAPYRAGSSAFCSPCPITWLATARKTCNDAKWRLYFRSLDRCSQQRFAICALKEAS